MNPILDLCESLAQVEEALPKRELTESEDRGRQALAEFYVENIKNLPENGWIDITQKFLNSCAELKLGELMVNTEQGLLSTMSDVEIVEPDFDVTNVYSKEEDLMYTFDSAVKSGKLKLKNLTPAELIGTFDALLACLVSWLEGDSMDHGLFTCLYLHSTSAIKDKAMRSFCHAIRCIIGQIQNIIEMADVNGEEDFEMYGSFQMKTFEESIPSTVTVQLKEAEIEWVYQRKFPITYPIEDSIAVVNRLRFMRHLYEIIFQFELFMLSAPDDSFITELFRRLNNNLDLIPQIMNTLHKGTQPQPENDMVNSVGFSSRNPQICLPTSTDLMQRLCDREGAFEFLEELMHRLKFACKVIQMEDFYTTLDFCTDFSSRSQNCILSRSILQGLFLNNKNEVFSLIPLKSFLRYSASTFNAPRVLNQKHALYADPTLNEHVDEFFDYILNTGNLTELICLCGFNYGRQRALLADILESFDVLQEKAVTLDTKLLDMALEQEASSQYVLASDLKQSAQFSIWVLFNTLRAINMYIATGFELELYVVNEFIYIYWYSYDCLFGSMSSVLQRAENNLLEEQKYINTQNKFKALLHSKKQKPKKYRNPTIKLFYLDIIYYHAQCNMAGGMFKALIALTKDGRIHQSKTFFNEECRFNQRFTCLNNLISPRPVTYEEYKKTLTKMMSHPTSEIYAGAAHFFDQARIELTSINSPGTDIVDLINVAKTNFVTMSVLSKGYQKGSTKQPEFRFGQNAYFPIISIK